MTTSTKQLLAALTLAFMLRTATCANRHLSQVSVCACLLAGSLLGVEFYLGKLLGDHCVVAHSHACASTCAHVHHNSLLCTYRHACEQHDIPFYANTRSHKDMQAGGVPSACWPGYRSALAWTSGEN